MFHSDRMRPRMTHSSRLIQAVVSLCAALLVWACNVSESNVEKIVNIMLDDSLTYEAGIYDTVRVDIHRFDGTMFKEKAFYGPYHKNPEGKLSIRLGRNVPDRFDILIIGYRKGEELFKLKISLSEGEVVDRDTLIVPKDPGFRVQVAVQPTSLSLEAGGPGERLVAKVTPDSVPQAVTWSSVNTEVASVDGTGKVTPLKEGETEIIARAEADTSRSARIPVTVAQAGTRKADSVRISQRQLTLYLGGSPGQLQGQVHPASLSLGVVFSSSEEGVVRVAPDGRISVFATGEAWVRIRPQGLAGPVDSCRVTVKKDPPVLVVGGDRQAKVGEELVFPIRVTQEHGGVALLKWDLDGDGRWDADSARDSVASPRRAYTEEGKDIRIGFYARDTEGNQDSVYRRVVVGSKTPFVTITRPAGLDTLVNTPDFTVKYEVDGVPMTRLEKLIEGANPVVVTATNEGGTGRDSVNIVLDSTPPATPNFVSQPPSVVNSADTRTYLEWSWTRGGAATDSFIVRLNDTVVVRQTATSFKVGNLAEGPYALQIVELDLAGNVSPSVSAALVTVDRVLPPAPNPSATSPTRDNTPTWTWTASEGRTFEYRLARDAAPNGTGTALSAPFFTPPSALQDGDWQFQVRERDAAGNWSTWSATSIVVLRAVPPAAPTVTRNAPASNAPRWSWTGGGGGNGIFRYRWSGAGTFLGEGRTTEYLPASLAEQAHSLCVSERDTVGFGSEACLAITFDRTAPVIAGVSVAEGFITNRSPILIRFNRDGTADSLSCVLVDNASTVCQREVSDAAGNQATMSRTVWYRSNVVFVKANGSSDGSSWERSASLDSVLVEGKNHNREIWVAGGDYSTQSTRYFNTGSGMKLFGGFSSIGYPASTSQRDPLANPSIITKRLEIADVGGPAQDVFIDGFTFTEWGHISMWDNSLRITIKNCSFANLVRHPPAAVDVRGTSIKLENLVIKNNSSLDYGAINVYHGSGSVEINGGDFRNNWATVGSAVMIYDGNVTIRNNAVFMGNSANGMPNQITLFGGHLDISGCQIQDGREGISVSEGATLIYGDNQTL